MQRLAPKDKLQLVEALKEWLADARMDEQEQTAINAARSEWQEFGGIEAGAFFRRLREEE